jgi:hypothetical protein
MFFFITLGIKFFPFVHSVLRSGQLDVTSTAVNVNKCGKVLYPMRDI